MNDEIIVAVKKTVHKVEPKADIYLYGSRARNNPHEYSDWDFLILVSGEVDTERTDRIRHKLYEVEWETGEVISSIVRSKNDWNNPNLKSMPFFQNIHQEGIHI